MVFLNTNAMIQHYINRLCLKKRFFEGIKVEQDCLLSRNVGQHFFYVLLCLFIFSTKGHAQVNNYIFIPSSGTYTEITGTDVLNTSNTFYNGIPLGFNFVFNGTSYSYVHVSSNGWMTLGTSATNNTITNATPVNNIATGTVRPIIAPLWDQLFFYSLLGTTGKVTYLMQQTGSGKVMTIQYSKVCWSTVSLLGANIEFQVKLYENSNRIDFIYNQVNIGVNIGLLTISASVGIGGASGNYLSLDGLGTAPNASSTTETATLSGSRPAIGQVYTWYPCAFTVTTTSNSICGPGTVNLGASAAGAAPVTGYRWYSDISGGTPLATTATGSWTTPSISSTTAYFVSAYNGNCESARTVVTATVNPLPSAITVGPSATADLCNGTAPFTVSGNISGGLQTLFSENFELSSVQMSNFSFTNPATAVWALYPSPSTIWVAGVSSGTKYAGITSTAVTAVNCALTMNAVLNTNNYSSLTLSFRHYFNYKGTTTPDQAVVEVYTVSGGWVAVKTYSSNQGLPGTFIAETIDLSAYINQSAFQVRFRYNSGTNYGWAIDDVSITGNALPSTVTWTPIAGLYTDAAATVPYVANANAATVYANPDTGTVYTATVTNATGCQLTTTASVTGVGTVWNGTSWSISPTSGQKLIFRGNYSQGVNLNGCSLTVESGNVTIPAGNNAVIQNTVKVNSAGGATFTLENTASLVQVSTTANSNTGNIIVKKNSQPMKRTDYTYWSSPVIGQTLVGFSPLTLSTKYYNWNAVAQQWVAHNGGTDVMIPAVGYIIRGPQSFSVTTPAVYSGQFVGVPNNGTIAVAVQGTSSAVPANYKWNLIGNPYPSAIFINSFLNDSENISGISGTVYLWTHNTPPSGTSTVYGYSSSDYAAYNLTGSTVTATAALSTGSNTNAPAGYIASGQSFFIRGLANQSVKFKNSMRVSSQNSQFFRMATDGDVIPAPVEDYTEKYRFWLNLTNEEGAFNQALIGYVQGATNGLDQSYDGDVFGGGIVSLYTIVNETKLTIQGRALPFQVTDVVLLGFKTTTAGTFAINIGELDGIFTDQDIFLKDNLLHTIHDLKSSFYSFTSPAGTFDDRFEIVYATNTVLGTEEKTIDLNSVIMYRQNNTLHIDAGKNSIKNVLIYDVTGKLIYTKKGIGTYKTALFDFVPQEQLLLVTIVTDQDKKVTKKIVY